MLNCRQLVELVTDYLENALDADARRATDEHLAGCADCLRYVGQMQTVIRLLGQLVEKNDIAQTSGLSEKWQSDNWVGKGASVPDSPG